MVCECECERVGVLCVAYDGRSRDMGDGVGLGETERGILDEECACAFAGYGKDVYDRMWCRWLHTLPLASQLEGRRNAGTRESALASRAFFCERPTTHLVAVGLYPVVVFSALAIGHGT